MSRYIKAALAVTRVTADIERNILEILERIREAAERGADLVLFPEAAITELVNDDTPSHDLPLGQPVPGPVTRRLAEAAAERRVYAAVGILEREGNSLYDSAVLFDREGRLVAKYRRMSRGWHGRDCDPSVYREGDSLVRVETSVGSMAFLICGDLFDDRLTESVRKMNVDYVLCPVSRCYDTCTYDTERWNRESRQECAQRGRLCGTTLLLVNSLAAPDQGADFGGALVTGPSGEVLAELLIGEPGLLLADLPPGRDPASRR